MEHIGPFLLAAMAVAAAVAAASETATTVPVAALPPLPALPVTAAASTLQPGTASCMDDLMPCATVSDDPTMLTPCCEAVAEVLKSDPECLCKVAEMSRNNTRKLASVSNNLDSDQQLFAQCKITGVSSDVCHKDKGHQGGTNHAVSSLKNVLTKTEKMRSQLAIDIALRSKITLSMHNGHLINNTFFQ
uniref:Bifunctional inhibitor/plant lipid transfer protein/seed storage helical domain-containing protein n=1 Tax=Oryza sativa subsp. japonica TaxID=39947 RepID=Q8H865_ORYSJ|nr:hypothetical protein [Oryza sativa Japonica Group]